MVRYHDQLSGHEFEQILRECRTKESGPSSGEGNGTPLQYSCLDNPWMEEPGRLQSTGPLRVVRD